MGLQINESGFGQICDRPRYRMISLIDKILIKFSRRQMDIKAEAWKIKSL